jgi:hypothetical protein
MRCSIASAALSMNFIDRTVQQEDSVIDIVANSLALRSGRRVLAQRISQPVNFTAQEVPEAPSKPGPEIPPGGNPELPPEHAPEVAPEPVPEITPDVTPGNTPEITPEVTPGGTPEIAPPTEVPH